MAQDIVPIELVLPKGDLLTLWAPRWREDGEEWEAFLGHEEDLYAFPDAAQLAAYTRTATEHDLIDHPAWHVVPALSVGELVPEDDNRYDLVGVPELVAEEPDTWTIGELADIVAILRSLADVCDLEVVHEVLDAAAGFTVLHQGTFPFTGREGEARWNEVAKVVAERWDEVLDAVDGLISTPETDATALATAREELAAYEEAAAEAEAGEPEDVDDESTSDDDEPVGFWGEVGIDPIKIITSQAEYYTLRCYLPSGDDEERPVFLGSDGQIDVFSSGRALARHLADSAAADPTKNQLAEVSTWEDVLAKATGGELEIDVHQDNTYVLNGVADDLAEGPESVDPTQLELAVELLTDAAEWADDDRVANALSTSEPLGWMVSFVLRPDPTRLAPSAPFTAEVGVWQELVGNLEDRLRTH
ncbi:primosomal protein [Allokutzneria oryzae]|uniref:Primosomal protein n=1 Tax=Allokutzneria oryzae TaxID=1378989 RepID=A0ABV5ZUV1_9PSEU